LNKHFGGIRAVQDFEFELQPGKITALIGPNGAGKTTLFNLITGFLKPTSGEITWHDHYLDRMSPHIIARQGISRTFQEVKLFRTLSIQDNLLIARGRGHYETLWSSAFKRPAFRAMADAYTEEIRTNLQTFNLSDRMDSPASDLSYGQSKLIEIVRASLTEPRLLLMDEPVAGLNPAMIEPIRSYISQLMDKGDLTIFLIEHNIPFVMEVADWVVVMDHGIKIAEGNPEAIRGDARVIEAYLGQTNAT
jgi:branched-chain amino acid transport system ATP-binding protein